MALVGWTPRMKREQMGVEEMTDFDLKDINTANQF